MSLVTNYMVLPSDDRDVEELNRALAELKDEWNEPVPQPPFRQVDKHAGGFKAMEASVWLLATNYFTPSEMIAVVGKIKWHMPAKFMFCGQDDDTWTVLDATPLVTTKPLHSAIIDLSACKEKP